MFVLFQLGSHNSDSTVIHALNQGSPIPGPRTGTGLWPVGSWAAQQEVSGGRASKASSVFTAAPLRSHYCLSSTSCQIGGSTGFL